MDHQAEGRHLGERSVQRARAQVDHSVRRALGFIGDPQAVEITLR
jgi:hypothetical protein